MPLHPVARRLLEEASASDRPNSHLLPISEARENFEATFAALPVDEVWSVRDLVADTEAGAVPLRLYRPDDSPLLPLVVYVHGGGWQMGSIASHDGIARAIANASGAAVVSVEYRRPPEHAFPAAPEDCVAALRWVAENADALGLDAERIAVAGDSAGGNLSLAVSLLARERGEPDLRALGLLYPATTFDFEVGFDMEHEGRILFKDEVKWHKDAYFAEPGDAVSPLASPLEADLRGLPPTFVITAEYDPLHGQGELLVDRLESAGVSVDHLPFPGMIHGFAQFPMLFAEADTAVAQLGVFLRRHLGAL